MVPGTDKWVHLPSKSQCWDMAILDISKNKRQFTASPRIEVLQEDVSKLASLFVQYLNSSLANHESSN